MLLPPFEGPVHKIERANRHIKELEELLEAYGESTELMYFKISETETHETYSFRFSQPPPWEVPLVIGDAIHNLRTALDIMVCDIARLRGKKAEYKFPFAADQEQLEKILSKEHRKIGDDVVKAIRKLGPYKEGGNPALRGLHDLDVSDKHRAVMPTFIIARGAPVLPPEFISMMEQQTGWNFENAYAPLKAGHTAIVAKGENPWDYVQPLKSAPEVWFPIELPFAGESALKVLKGLAEYVAKIVDGFLIEFGSGSDPTQTTPVGN